MSYQALYRVWRPETFEDIVGQDAIVKTLTNQILTGRVAHAYLFCGSRGTGKTTTSKVFARAINCMHPKDNADPCGECEACVQLSGEANMDVIEIDAASNNGVDEIRDLREKIQYPPSVGRYKVYIIDEVHMLSAGAFNALLKTLEEPPGHAVFILATTEPQRLPATILSRCQRFDFKRIPAKVIVERLKRIVAAGDVPAEEEALSDIARAAEGGMRDAISLLDMCLSYAGERLTPETVREALGTSDKNFLFDFAGALIREDAMAALVMIDRAMRDGKDAAALSREITGHVRALLIAQFCKDELADLLETSEDEARRMIRQAENAPREKLMRAMDLFVRAESEMKWYSQPRAVLELYAVRCCHPEKEVSVETLLERVEKLELMLKNGVQLAQPTQRSAASEPTEQRPAPENAQSAPKPAPPPKQEKEKPTSKPADDADAGLWKEAVRRISEKNGSMTALVGAAVFDHRDENIVHLVMPKKWRMYLSVLSQPAKKEIVEAELAQVFGRPMRMTLTLEGDAPVKPAAEARQTLAQAYEVFGRENVVVMDDE